MRQPHSHTTHVDLDGHSQHAVIIYGVHQEAHAFLTKWEWLRIELLKIQDQTSKAKKTGQAGSGKGLGLRVCDRRGNSGRAAFCNPHLQPSRS